MREIVHIQAGQCGNQIGAKVNTMFFYTSYRLLSGNRLRMCGRHFVTPSTNLIVLEKRGKSLNN